MSQLTKDQQRRVLEAIGDCDRFIEREEKRSADLRPADVAKHLEFCKQHKVNLISMLEA